MKETRDEFETGLVWLKMDGWKALEKCSQGKEQLCYLGKLNCEIVFSFCHNEFVLFPWKGSTPLVFSIVLFYLYGF